MPGMKSAWVTIALALLVSACGSGDACDRPQEYVYSKSGQRLVVPEDLSTPDSVNNREIPPISEERKARTDPCTVLPPELVIDRSRVQAQAPAPEPVEVATDDGAPLEIGEAFNGGPLATLNAWVDAWSRADIPTYLAFYSNDYRTPGEAETRDSWLRRRKELLENTGPADIAIRDVTLENIALGRILIRLVQDFNGSDLTRSVVKIMELVPEGGGYRIRHEWVVGVE